MDNKGGAQGGRRHEVIESVWPCNTLSTSIIKTRPKLVTREYEAEGQKHRACTVQCARLQFASTLGIAVAKWSREDTPAR